MKYQYGFSLFGFIVWFSVSHERFAKKVAGLILLPSQAETIKPEEIVGIFTSDFVLRDGFRLYRIVGQKEREPIDFGIPPLQ